MLYVILLVTLLCVLSVGFLTASRNRVKAVLANRNYMEAQLTARTIHQSFCESVASGDSEAVNLVWRCFEEDCDRVQEAFDAMLDGEEEEEEEGEGEEEDRWDRYLSQVLGEKEYTVSGSTSTDRTGEEDKPRAEITLRVWPLQEAAQVHTRVECNGYRFSLMADLVFDDREGAVIVLPGPDRGADGSSERKVYLNGNGVYRYYGGSSDGASN